MKFIFAFLLFCCFVTKSFAGDDASKSVQNDIASLKAFVDIGLEHIKKVGDVNRACKDFASSRDSDPKKAKEKDKKNKFIRGDQYLFVFNFNGKVLVNNGDINSENKNLFNAKDKFGTPYFQLFVEAANRGGGVVSYYWTNPSTNTSQYKTSYIAPINDISFIGSGVYRSLDVPQSQEVKINELKKFVHSGVDYINKNGTKKAYEAFSNPNGQFIKNDWYIFVVDYKGVVWAHGGDPKKMIGTSIADLKDEFGTPLLMMFTEAARSKGGVVSYYWPHYTETGKLIKFKTSYIEPLDSDKDKFIGAGYYEVQGK